MVEGIWRGRWKKCEETAFGIKDDKLNPAGPPCASPQRMSGCATLLPAERLGSTSLSPGEELAPPGRLQASVGFAAGVAVGGKSQVKFSSGIRVPFAVQFRLLRDGILPCVGQCLV